jgi:hypothetical protein
MRDSNLKSNFRLLVVLRACPKDLVFRGTEELLGEVPNFLGARDGRGGGGNEKRQNEKSSQSPETTFIRERAERVYRRALLVSIANGQTDSNRL